MSDTVEGEVKKKKKLKKKIGSSNSLDFTVEKEQPYDCLEPDEWYTGEFESASVEDGKFGKYVKFAFKILDGQTESGKDANGRTVTRIMDAVVAPGKPLGEWFKVFSGKDIEVGAKVSLRPYFGNKYRVFVTDKKAKKGEVMTKRFQLIEKIKKIPKVEKE